MTAGPAAPSARRGRTGTALQAAVGVAISAAALWLTLRGRDLGAIWQAMRAGRLPVPGPLRRRAAGHPPGAHRALGAPAGAGGQDPVRAAQRRLGGRLHGAGGAPLPARRVRPAGAGGRPAPAAGLGGPLLGGGGAGGRRPLHRRPAHPDAAGGAGRDARPRPGPGGRRGHVARLRAACSSSWRAPTEPRRGGPHHQRGSSAPLSPRLAAKVARDDGRLHPRPPAGLRAGARPSPSCALTAFYWFLNGWGMYLLAKAFDLDLGLIDAFTVLGVLVVGVMIPAGPGMVGTFQAAVVLGLSLFVPTEAAAARGPAYANVLWAVQIGVQVAAGAGLPALQPRAASPGSSAGSRRPARRSRTRRPATAPAATGRPERTGRRRTPGRGRRPLDGSRPGAI